MNNRARLFLIALICSLASCSQPDLYDLKGEGIYLTRLHEKALVVNYWATWCAPCIKEIPELNHLAETKADQLLLLGVNFDQPQGEEALKQARKMKIEFPVLQGNPAEKLKVAVPAVLPTTYVFAKGGELKATLVGPQTEASILAVLDAN